MMGSVRGRLFLTAGLTAVLMLLLPLLPVPASAAGRTTSIRLPSANGSDVSGRVRITEVDGVVTIRVWVVGAAGSYLPYLHRGTCEQYASQPAIPLAITTSDAPTRTTVDLGYDELMSGKYVVDLHLVKGDFNYLLDPVTSVACGVLIEPKQTAATTKEPAAIHAPETGAGPLFARSAVSISLALVLGAACCLFTYGLRLRRPAVYVRSRVVRRRYRGLMQ